MTEIYINLPERIEINGELANDVAQIPLIPAEKITGILLPEQIPVGVIPGVEDVVQVQAALTELDGRVSDLEEEPKLSPAALTNHVETHGKGGHIPLFGLTNDEIAEGAAISSSKLDLSSVDFVSLGAQPFSTKLAALTDRNVTEFGLDLLESVSLAALKTFLEIPQIVDDPGDIGSQPSDSDLTAIAQLSTTSFGRSLLTLADAAALSALLPSGVYQPLDSDLSAIAALTTTSFGRSLLTLADAAAVRQAIGAAELGASGPPTLSDLSYTVTQSSLYNNTEALRGTVVNLTDGSGTTGAATQSASTTGQRQWIKVDLGSVKWVHSVAFGAGSLGNGFGNVSTYLNNLPIQVSVDDLTWNTVIKTFGFENNTYSVEWFSVGSWARYIRLLDQNSFIATTELRVKGDS